MKISNSVEGRILLKCILVNSTLWIEFQLLDLTDQNSIIMNSKVAES